MGRRSILNSTFFKVFQFCAVLAALWAMPAIAAAQENTGDGTPKKFNPKDVIFEHIGDSHSLHIFGKFALPLPVILYTDKGFEAFSSSRLKEEEIEGKTERKIYQGKYYSYTSQHDKIKIADANGKTDDAASKKIIDFSITRNVASMWMAIVILLVVFISVSSSYKKRVGKAPKGMQSFMEPVILFVRDDVAIPNIGTKHTKYMPLLLTVFFFILINNLLGLVPFFPGGYNLTGNIAVTLTLAVISLLTVNFSGNKILLETYFTARYSIMVISNNGPR